MSDSDSDDGTPVDYCAGVLPHESPAASDSDDGSVDYNCGLRPDTVLVIAPEPETPLRRVQIVIL